MHGLFITEWQTEGKKSLTEWQTEGKKSLIYLPVWPQRECKVLPIEQLGSSHVTVPIIK